MMVNGDGVGVGVGVGIGDGDGDRDRNAGRRRSFVERFKHSIKSYTIQ